jgi:hypothetical protein
MIRVLILANDSLLAHFIESALSQQRDLAVFRGTRDEPGARRDYAVVILVDEGLAEDELIRLQEFMHEDAVWLLIRVSVNNRNVYVNESYQLFNPGMNQLIQLVREFNRAHLAEESGEDTGSQKKMNSVRLIKAAEYDRQQTSSAAGRLFLPLTRVNLPHQSGSNASGSLQSEIPVFFYSFFLHYLRLQEAENVTPMVTRKGRRNRHMV